jgi:hypothetical protein
VHRIVWLLAWVFSLATLEAQTNITVRDIFGRSLNGITLIDWEGFIANPAITLALHPPTNAVFPATAILRASGDRLYFDSPSQNTANGAVKAISFSSAASSRTVLLSIFPDRDWLDETYTFRIEFAATMARDSPTAFQFLSSIMTSH